MMETTITDIALWGPMASGKTSLIHAFGTVITRRYSSGDLAYEITDEDGRPVLDFGTPKELEATKELTPINWGFRRRGQQNTPSHKVSSHYHRITIFDDRGESEVRMLKDPDGYRPTLEHIATCNCMMILLDHALLSDVEERLDVSTLVDDAAAPVFTREEYYQNILQLLGLLNEPEYKTMRRIAVCLTKVDLLGKGFRDLDPWRLIAAYFNTRDADMVRLLQSVRAGGSEVEAFAVSARDNDETRWTPVNVEFPFFWLFESIERERLRKVDSKALLAGLFTDQRLSNYEPYPRRHRR